MLDDYKMLLLEEKCATLLDDHLRQLAECLATTHHLPPPVVTCLIAKCLLREAANSLTATQTEIADVAPPPPADELFQHLHRATCGFWGERVIVSGCN